MNVKLENVSINVEVILFNDEKVLILSKGKKNLELFDTQVIPMWDKGRLIEFMMGYQGEYFKSFVVGRDKKIVKFGYILDNNITDIEIQKAVNINDIQFVESDGKSNRILLYFE